MPIEVAAPQTSSVPNEQGDSEAAMSTEAAWRAIVGKYRCADDRIAAWQLANTVLPYLALLAVMFHSVRGPYAVTLLLAVPAAVLGRRIAHARRRHLTQRILVGVPEMSSSDKGRLLTDGIYGRVRNPRYLGGIKAQGFRLLAVTLQSTASRATTRPHTTGSPAPHLHVSVATGLTSRKRKIPITPLPASRPSALLVTR